MLHRGSKVITCTHMKSARENWGSKVITRNNCACAEGDTGDVAIKIITKNLVYFISVYKLSL